jgi:hypothetical protein
LEHVALGLRHSVAALALPGGVSAAYADSASSDILNPTGAITSLDQAEHHRYPGQRLDLRGGAERQALQLQGGRASQIQPLQVRDALDMMWMKRTA